MIDLTKEIVVDHEMPIDEMSSRLWFSVILDSGPTLEDGQWTQAKAEAYETLFQEATRIKREHEKMLALLKKIGHKPVKNMKEGGYHEIGPFNREARALIAEIEGEK